MNAAADNRHAPLTPVLPPQGLAVKLVGCGGVGAQLARPLCCYLAGLQVPCRVLFADGDVFEPANLARVLFPRPGNKAAILRDDLAPLVGSPFFTLLALPEYVTAQNVARLIGEGDIVLLCLDNHASRKLINDFCRGAGDGGPDKPAGRRNVVLISGGNDGVEVVNGQPRRGTYGSVQVYIRRDGQDITPDLSQFHPEIAKPADRLPTEKGCSEMLNSVPQLLAANAMVAAVMLSTLVLVLCDRLHYGEIAFDIADGLMRPLPLFPPAPPEGAAQPPKTRTKSPG